MARQYSRDPLYNWLAVAIPKKFKFLQSGWGLKQCPVEANVRGCWVKYKSTALEVEIWAEMGERPECFVVVNGRRQVLGIIVGQRWPELKPPPEPEYTDIEGNAISSRC